MTTTVIHDPTIVVVTSPGEYPVTVVRDNTIVAVTAPGPQGPSGPQGPPGGSAYVHTQTSPAATWIINHNLGRKVHVTLFDPAETVVHADIDHGTINQTTITWASPATGSAVLS